MSEYKYQLDFMICVFSGISNEIEFQLEHGTECQIEKLQYLVDKYNKEYGASSVHLYELLDKYKEKWNL